ncbi:MAG: sugar transferase [Candidatus Manganitrophus sp.]|nr:sugar transferase [Candidatus Manganitrophus sp.]MDC4226504.1 sugar transferase [Candidatus Manganitrophus sp.]WDT72307.1 MAG: sugar transferase [Candidatus Manganitrophus sp.]WDT75451.1 MAG: sugar transferase [Candidatus Manganitrophus sp.]WDT80258.1 MAG: sugar transferase [Candidatus Manganitrophus sp.]
MKQSSFIKVKAPREGRRQGILVRIGLGKRIFDVLIALILICLLLIPMLVIALFIKITSKGPVLYWSDRVGVNNAIFKMPKFRTMKIDTPAVATHLLENPYLYITRVGGFIRKTSLDELPQLFSILRGEISFVGPRPALFNQDDLIDLRTQKGIHKLIPGLTGWAQVNGRDDLPIPKKVEFDEYYLKHQSFSFDIKILFMTFLKVIRSEGVNH